jgi:hypothetical protein
MRSTVWVFLGIATAISLAYAESFEAPKLEPSINGAVLASELFPSQAYAAAFQHGTRYVCKQPGEATWRYANMLQANCVAANMSGGVGWNEILWHCFGGPQRSAFERRAEKICAALNSHSGFFLARDGQSAQSGGCIPSKGCLRH